MAKKIMWVAGYGPDRSHDMLYSDVFESRSKAEAFVKGKPYWRISRLEYTKPWEGYTSRVDEIGGVDVDREIEKARIEAQYKTGRRVSEAEAIALWRKNMRARHGPGGRMANPRRSGINDRERELWVINDEGLYLDWKRSRLPMRKYLRQNREWLDRIIQAASSGIMRNPIDMSAMCRHLADAIMGAADRGDPSNFARAKRLMQFAPEDLAILRMEHPSIHPNDRGQYAYETYLRLTWHPTHPSAVKWLTGHYPAFWEKLAKARSLENPRRRRRNRCR